MAIDVRGGKIERTPLVEQWLKILNVASWACRLDFVVVDDRSEIRQLVLAGAQGGLPHRAFVNLTVTHDDDDAAIALLDARRKRHADAVG